MSRIENIEMQLFRPLLYKELFERVDTNGDGYVSYIELKNLFDNDPILKQRISKRVLRKIHVMADTNQDGRLDYEEFVKMIKSRKFKKHFDKLVNKYVKLIVPTLPKHQKSNLDANKDRQTDSFIPKFDKDLLNEYEQKYSCSPPKIAMILLSIIELICFLIDEFGSDIDIQSKPVSGILIFDPNKKYQFWRFFSYMFVHIGYVHLVVNLTSQIIFGVALEMVHGWWRVLLVYFSGVISGSLATSVLDPRVFLAGASGGVYALLTSHVASIIINWKKMTQPLVQIALLSVILIGDVGVSIYDRYFGEMMPIGYIAHVGGAIAGLLVGFNVLRNLGATRYTKILKWVCFGVYIALSLGAVFWNLYSLEIISF